MEGDFSVLLQTQNTHHLSNLFLKYCNIENLGEINLSTRYVSPYPHISLTETDLLSYQTLKMNLWPHKFLNLGTIIFSKYEIFDVYLLFFAFFCRLKTSAWSTVLSRSFIPVLSSKTQTTLLSWATKLTSFSSWQLIQMSTISLLWKTK